MIILNTSHQQLSVTIILITMYYKEYVMIKVIGVGQELLVHIVASNEGIV